MSRPRDSQRAKVYRAERHAWGEAAHHGSMTHDEVVALAEGLADRFGLAVPVVRHRTSGHRSWGGITKEGRPYIGLTPRDRNAMVVCHELAHAWLDHEARGLFAWHSPQWCRVYLMLVHEVLGGEAHDHLEDAFEVYGVDWASGVTAAVEESVA